MQYPKISIVTPSYNQGDFIEETILSVLEQNYPNLEYLIMDGGSTDQSVEIIKKYEKYLTYWVSEKDRGMYEAIQKGFAKTNGDIMAWLNSDDKYHPKAFSVVQEILAQFPEVNWLTGSPTLWDEAGRCVYIDKMPLWSKYNFYLGRVAWIQQESTFWRRSLWQQAGGSMNTTFRLAGDFELWMRFFRYDSIYVVNALIGGFRRRKSNQLTIEHLAEYKAEADTILAKESQNLSKEIKKRLWKIKFYEKILNYRLFNTHFLQERYFDSFAYTKRIVFNSESYQFELRNINYRNQNIL
jgi:glycosyltransferase involved in cell wall biosynthesis